MFNQTSNQVIQLSLRARLCPLNSMAHECLVKNRSIKQAVGTNINSYLFTRQMKGLAAGFLLAAISHVICTLLNILERAMKCYWPSFMLNDSVWCSLQWRPFLFSKEAMIVANMLFTSTSMNEHVYVMVYICMLVYVA